MKYSSTLGKFFPGTDSRTSWVVRLAILRDDLGFETQQIAQELAAVRDQAPRKLTKDAIWRISYFVRRHTVTISEIANIFRAGGKDGVSDLMKSDTESARLLQETKKAFDEAELLVKPVRDSIGGHVRPSSSRLPLPEGSSSPEEAVAKYHGDSWQASVVLGPKHADTTLRELTAGALLYAWPDALNAEDHDRRFAAFVGKLQACMESALDAIDQLLSDFWNDVGLKPE